MPPAPPQKPFEIAICGGGIGGLTLAIGLQTAGIPYTLYEAAPAFAEIGAGVSFGPNAVRAMSLISPAIKAGYDRRETRNEWHDKKEVWFDFRIGQEDWKREKAPAKAGTWICACKVAAGEVGQSSTHRAHFLDELVNLIPKENAKFGKRLAGLQEVSGAGGKIKLTFEDGTTAEADAVVGCDGIKSKTRQILLGEGHSATDPVFSGRYAYRGLIPMDKAVKAVGEELARNSQMYLGHHGHVLTFPIEKGRTMNVVAFQTKMDKKWEHEQWVLPMKKEDMFKDFEGWGASVKEILTLMEKPDVWALFDHPPAPTFYQGRLCLMGDAAHATTPHQGAGAGQAIEDSYILSGLLSRVNSAHDLEKAFKAFDQIRRPRTQKVVTTSRQASDLYEFENEEIGFDLEQLSHLLNTRLKWIWEEDLPAQLNQAIGLMGDTAKL